MIYTMRILKTIDNMHVLYVICNTYILYAVYCMRMMLGSHSGAELKKRWDEQRFGLELSSCSL